MLGPLCHPPPQRSHHRPWWVCQVCCASAADGRVLWDRLVVDANGPHIRDDAAIEATAAVSVTWIPILLKLNLLTAPPFSSWLIMEDSAVSGARVAVFR